MGLQAGVAAVTVGVVFGVGLWQNDGVYPIQVAPAEEIDPTIAAYLAKYNLTPPPEETVFYSAYEDGTYSATATYKAAGTTNDITVEVQIVGGAVRALATEDNSPDRTSQRYQERFAAVVADSVVGRSINELDIRSLAGATLTAKGFRAAVNAIREEAKSDGAQQLAL